MLKKGRDKQHINVLFSYNKMGEIMIKNLKGIVVDVGHGGLSLDQKYEWL